MTGPTPVLPTAVCSVVWTRGHPYIRDGEPGTSTPRRWVGLTDDGTPEILTDDQMLAAGFSVIHDDASAQEDDALPARWRDRPTVPDRRRGPRGRANR